MASIKASAILSSSRQTSNAFSNWPSMRALVIRRSDSDSDPEYIWNGLLVFVPLVAASSDKKSPSGVLSNMDEKRL